MFTNTSGVNNTALGFWSLYSNTTGTDNTASGNLSLYANTTGTGQHGNGQRMHVWKYHRRHKYRDRDLQSQREYNR